MNLLAEPERIFLLFQCDYAVRAKKPKMVNSTQSFWPRA